MIGMVRKESMQKILNVLRAVYPEAMSKSGIHITTQVHNYTITKAIDEMVSNGWVEEIKIKHGNMHAAYRWRGT